MTALKITDRRHHALAGGPGGPAYDAADFTGQHMALWNPFIGSPDTELNPYRDRIVARSRDLVRNDGWANGAITRACDNMIGGTYRPVSKPDYRALTAMTGIKAFDATWADEYGRAIDAAWRIWADDTGRYCDAARKMNFRQISRVAFRHEIIDGDSLALVLWLPDRIGEGRAHYATTVQLVDPDRLSNPTFGPDMMRVRGGVEIDDFGAPIAYHVRKAHPGDFYDAAKSVSWERVLREDQFGRPRVVHNFTADRAGQHRGGAGILTPVLQRLKMLIKYDGTELDAAILNSIFGAFVTSPMDPQLVKEAMGVGDEIDSNLNLNGYQDLRQDFHRENRLTVGGARIPILVPGEEIKTVSAARPNGNFGEFESAVLRNVAAGVGLSAQQISNNWSDVNYSSARGALLEAWKTMDRRAADFGDGFAQPIRVALMEEIHDVEDLPLPAGAPPFMAARGAYSRCRWMQPGKGWMDPVKEKQGAILGLASCLNSLEEVAADQGMDSEELIDQRAIEIQRFKEAKVPPPAWMVDPTAMQATSDAADATQAADDREAAKEGGKK